MIKLLKENFEVQYDIGKSIISLEQSNNFIYRDYSFTNEDLIEMLNEKLEAFNDQNLKQVDSVEQDYYTVPRYESILMNSFDIMLEATNDSKSSPELHVSNLKINFNNKLAQFNINGTMYTVSTEIVNDDAIYEGYVTRSNGTVEKLQMILKESNNPHISI